MIALDTNVLVRHLTQDDPPQTAAARRLLSTLTQERPGFISLSVVLELYWVLDRALGLPGEVVLRSFDGLMASYELEIEDGESVGEALEQARRGADFADALIDATNRVYGITETVTFDKEAARRFGWRLLA